MSLDGGKTFEGKLVGGANRVSAARREDVGGELVGGANRVSSARREDVGGELVGGANRVPRWRERSLYYYISISLEQHILIPESGPVVPQ